MICSKVNVLELLKFQCVDQRERLNIRFYLTIYVHATGAPGQEKALAMLALKGNSGLKKSDFVSVSLAGRKIYHQ